MVVLISSDEDDLSEGGNPGSLKKTAGLPKDKVSVIRPFCYVGKGGTERKEVRVSSAYALGRTFLPWYEFRKGRIKKCPQVSFGWASSP